MKCLLKTEEGIGYNLTDIGVPKPGEGDLLVKVIKVSLCGSDIQLYKWTKVAQAVATLPLIPGHECVGEIVEVGINCPPEYTVGRRVCCENHFYCGNCYQCHHDQRHICQNLNQYGHGRGTMHGGLSQYTIIPARYAYLLQTDIPSDIATLLEPFGVAHQGVEKLLPKDQTVLIQGCGPIGLYAIGLCKYFGAERIIATDIVPKRMELAKEMGADVVIDGKTENLKEKVMSISNNNGVGCLLEVSGAQPLVNNSFQLVRRGGTIVFIGIPKGAIHVEDCLKDFLFKSLTLHTIYGRKIFSTWEQCEKILYEKSVDISSTISHVYPMTEYQKAFTTLINGDGVKILVDPQA